METKKTKMKWWNKTLIIIGSFFGGLFSLILVVLLSLNIVKFSIYSDYYSIREIVCTNHGLNDNYVSQGTAITNDGNYVITSGYMKDKTASRIYITNTSNNTFHCVSFLKPDGKAAKYHFGGVAVSNDTIFLASNDSIFTVSLTEAMNNDELTLNLLFEVNNSASFVFVDDTYIYVGEFYDGKQYVTENSLTYNNKTYNAIVEQYTLGSYTAPYAVYGIRDKVQGFAVSDKGDMLLSTSFGLTSSNFYYYKNTSVINTGETYLSAPLYVLENEDFKLSGPAMSEDLDFLNGKFYTNFESACNKYIFGKFFFNSDKIVALDFSGLIN